MKHISVIVVLLSAAMLLSCGSGNEREKAQNVIKQMELSTFDYTQTINAQKADSLVNMYSSYVNRFPEDTLCASYLFRAADILANRNKCMESVAMYERLIRDYPSSRYVEESYFLRGVVYSQVCLNKDKSRECFNEFISKYPQSRLVDDANGLMMMDTLSDEMEIIRKFEQMNSLNK